MSILVIEGLDGSGKSTQLNLLREYFEKQNIKHKYLHFPRTDSPFFGELIARFLRGDMGDNNSVDPYLVALIYAGDRNDAAREIDQWINEGYTILLDRYVCSNIAYQCAKLQHKDEQQKLMDWILRLEYQYFGIPMPKLNFFLDVPFSFTRRKLTTERLGDERSYLDGKSDIHEADLDFQQRVKDMYLFMAREANLVSIIDCSEGEAMLAPTVIFEKIRESLKTNGIIR